MASTSKFTSEIVSYKLFKIPQSLLLQLLAVVALIYYEFVKNNNPTVLCLRKHNLLQTLQVPKMRAIGMHYCILKDFAEKKV